MREDILITIGEHDLTVAQAQVLLDSLSPLADVFKYYNKQDCPYLDTMWESIQGRANDVRRHKRRSLSIITPPHTPTNMRSWKHTAHP